MRSLAADCDPDRLLTAARDDREVVALRTRSGPAPDCGPGCCIATSGLVGAGFQRRPGATDHPTPSAWLTPPTPYRPVDRLASRTAPARRHFIDRPSYPLR